MRFSATSQSTQNSYLFAHNLHLGPWPTRGVDPQSLVLPQGKQGSQSVDVNTMTIVEIRTYEVDLVDSAIGRPKIDAFTGNTLKLWIFKSGGSTKDSSEVHLALRLMYPASETMMHTSWKSRVKSHLNTLYR